MPLVLRVGRVGRGVRVVRGVRESRVIRRGRADSDYILADRAGGMDLCDYQGDSDRMATAVGGGMAGGCSVDGVCMAVAAVAVAAGDDGTELLSDSVAVSTMEWIR